MVLPASALFFAIYLLLQPFSPLVVALPTSSNPAGQGQGPMHFDLKRRSPPASLTLDYLSKAADHARLKHGYAAANSTSRADQVSARHAGMARASSPVDISTVDQFHDKSYAVTLLFGSPPQPFDLVLDTGSGNLWVFSTPCPLCAPDTPLFDASKSTTFQGTRDSFEIAYGVGDVQGFISTDVVTMGGITIKDQVFTSVNLVDTSPVSAPLSGILGLEFGPDATASTETNTLPFWMSLLKATSATALEMSFFMKRHLNDSSVTSATQLSPGGVFTLGGTNSSLFEGDIEFLNVVDTSTNPDKRWFLNLEDVTVQGKAVPITTGTSALAQIDTGTTLIGGPSADVKAIWAAVPGSAPIPSLPGYYSYPCSTTVSISLSFGGKSWAIDPRDMNFGNLSSAADTGLCVGAIFDLGAGTDTGTPGQGSPGWIVGDTFLKNVYSVFRVEPFSIGFAQLSQAALGVSNSSSSSPNAGNVQKPKNGALSSAMAPKMAFLGAAGVAIGMHYVNWVF